MDRFFIAPFEKDKKNVLFGMINKNTKGSIMKKRFYKQRSDIKNEISNSYGDLTVVREAPRDSQRGANWFCKCKCGNECVIKGGDLRSGARVSCGCRAESKIDQTGVNRIYASYKRKAKLRNKLFEITRNECEILIKSNCFYCGNTPSQILKRLKTRKIQIIYNGIDRKDPDIGYIFSNCVSACRFCNQSKSDLSIEQWKIQLKRICKWLKIDSL